MFGFNVSFSANCFNALFVTSNFDILTPIFVSRGADDQRFQKF